MGGGYGLLKKRKKKKRGRIVGWFTAGVQANPVADAILADTGAAAGPGQTSVTVTLGGNVAFVATLEHRNAANGANVNSQVVACAANDAVQFAFYGISYAANERFRVRLNAGVTGSIQVSINSF